MKLIEIAYFTDKVSEMAQFYQRLLGTSPVAQSAGMAIFMTGDTKIFIHQLYEPNPGDLAPEDHIAFEVADVDAACSRLAAQGLIIEVPPQDYYWGRSAYLRDPGGQLIELNAPAAPAQ